MEQEENTGTGTAYAQSTAREQAKGAERKRLRHPRYAGERVKSPGITGTTESRARYGSANPGFFVCEIEKNGLTIRQFGR